MYWTLLHLLSSFRVLGSQFIFFFCLYSLHLLIYFSILFWTYFTSGACFILCNLHLLVIATKSGIMLYEDCWWDWVLGLVFLSPVSQSYLVMVGKVRVHCTGKFVSGVEDCKTAVIIYFFSCHVTFYHCYLIFSC